MIATSFDIRFENELIRNMAKEVYEDFIESCNSHASRRSLENDFVTEKCLSEFLKLARKDGIVK